MLSDEEILKRVALDMGLEWVEGPGYITVAGRPVDEYLKNHGIFDNDFCDMNFSLDITLDRYDEQRFFPFDERPLDAA